MSPPIYYTAKGLLLHLMDRTGAPSQPHHLLAKTNLEGNTDEIAPAAFAFLQETLHNLCKGPSDHVTGIKLLIPTKECYVSRSDATESHLRGCILVDKVESFVEPLQRIETTILVVRSHSLIDVKEQLAQLESDFVDRLSYGWLLERPLPRRRLAFVQGLADAEGSIGLWRSALALGISLVIFDAEGHWMQDSAWSDIREALVPLDIAPDPMSDSQLPAVARAAEVLGFTTNPSKAYDIAGDKYTTRKLEPSASESFQCTSVDQLHAHLHDAQLQPSRYPLIVKPCTG
ncbi:hypothetical protein F5X97DRAFT_338051 [Nemania serpens]|nr:hypothetical protein F5X97DRAFT_338051 [Nemania serpens]